MKTFVVGRQRPLPATRPPTSPPSPPPVVCKVTVWNVMKSPLGKEGNRKQGVCLEKSAAASQMCLKSCLRPPCCISREEADLGLKSWVKINENKPVWLVFSTDFSRHRISARGDWGQADEARWEAATLVQHLSLGPNSYLCQWKCQQGQVWDQALTWSGNLIESSPELLHALKIIICHNVSRI